MVTIKWTGVFVAEDNDCKKTTRTLDFKSDCVSGSLSLLAEYIEDQSQFGWVLEDQEILTVSER
jgi:hypothetical protein